MIENNYIRQFFLIGIIAFLSIIIFLNLREYLPSFLGAYTIFILLKKWQLKLTVQKKWKPTWAALALIVFTILVVVIPLNLILVMLGQKVVPLVQNYTQVISSIEQSVQHLEAQYHVDILNKETIQKAGDWALQKGQSMISETLNSVLVFSLMFVFLYFMLTEHKTMDRGLYRILPISSKSTAYLKKHLNELVFSNAVGIPLVALAQGIMALIIYWILGVPDAFLWFIATTIAAVFPLVGAALVYVPLSIYLAMQGQTTQSIVLLLYGVIVIGSADNVFRFWIQKNLGDTHPLVTIFGVIVGVNLFGFIGLVFGPILFAILVLFYNIYQIEYGEETEDLLRESTEL